MFWSHPNDSWHLVVKLICTLCRVEAALEQRRQAIVPFSVMYHEPFLNANIPAAIQHICQISPNPRPCSQSKTYVTTGRPYWEHAGWNLTRLQADWPMRRKLIKIAPDRTIFKHGSSGVPEFEQYCPLYPAWPLCQSLTSQAGGGFARRPLNACMNVPRISPAWATVHFR